MRQTLRIAFGLLYLLAFIFSLIVLLKPDASFFYKNQQIDPQKLVPEGNALAYQFTINTHFYDPDTISVLEDQHPLTLSASSDATSLTKGSFAITNLNKNPITLLIASTAGSHNYTIDVRPYLISSNLGGLVALILLLGMIAFLASNLNDLQKRKSFLSSPFGMIKSWVNGIDRPAHELKTVSPKYRPVPDFVLLKHSVINTLLISFLYVFMEWIFYATKPSFMDLLTWGQKIQILLMTGFAVALLALLLVLVIALLDLFLSPFSPTFHKYALHFSAAFLLACLCLILIDNFTYTVLNFGIVDTTTLVRLLYGLGFVGAFIYFIRWLSTAQAHAVNQLTNKITSWSAIALTLVSLILVGLNFENSISSNARPGQSTSSDDRPNIIVFGTDGLNAANTSLYGYDRDTTPFIDELAQSSLVGENNFSNAGASLGSDTSILTGKMALTTRVLYAPDILQGIDEYQHLPGMLKDDGYRTVFLGEKYYDDVNSIDFQDAFDSVQCKENEVAISSLISGYGFDEETYFFTTLWGRITDRVEHIFFIKDMVNPYVQVTQTAEQDFNDQDRMQCLFSELDRADRTGQPVFIQVHLEDTHGGTFWPTTHVFSKGETQDEDWMTDWYDDAILDYDAEVKQLVQHLKDNGQYNNTVLILYTDHAQQYNPINEIPLLFHFPNGQYAGTITQNTENLDMAPTILEYLKIAQPTWMVGSSLLGKLDPDRLILDPSVVYAVLNSEGLYYVPTSSKKPPFYQFRSLTAIQCQNWFTFNLQDMTVTQGTVTNYTDPCPANSLDSLDTIREKVGAMLKQNGFNLPDNW